jgi:hypothetical protein
MLRFTKFEELLPVLLIFKFQMGCRCVHLAAFFGTLHINISKFVLKRTASEIIMYCAWVVFQNEAMTGTHTQNPVYSRITLALMEDTGWYRANYSMAQPLSWGKDFGCDFAMKSCKEWMDNKTLRWVLFADSYTPCTSISSQKLYRIKLYVAG